LTQQQVVEVLREAHASEAIKMPQLLAGLVAREDIPPLSVWEERSRREASMSQFSLSLVKGLLVLACLINGEPTGVREVATELGMGESTACRYLRTLLMLGLVEQDSGTRRYRVAL
jgi:hypothetical protein